MYVPWIVIAVMSIDFDICKNCETKDDEDEAVSRSCVCVWLLAWLGVRGREEGREEKRGKKREKEQEIDRQLWLDKL